MLIVRWFVDLARVIGLVLLEFQKRRKNNIRIFLFLPEHVLLVLKRTVSTKQLFWAHVTSVKLADKTKRIMLIVRWRVDLAIVIVLVLLEFQHYCSHKLTEAH